MTAISNEEIMGDVIEFDTMKRLEQLVGKEQLMVRGKSLEYTAVGVDHAAEELHALECRIRQIPYEKIVDWEYLDKDLKEAHWKSAIEIINAYLGN